MQHHLGLRPYGKKAIERYCYVMLAGAAVCYQTRLQPTIAQSSTEAEFTNINRALQAVNSQICLTKVEIIGTSYL
jgi:hypothetical protein